MLDWLGSVRVRSRSATRVELELTRATSWTGWGAALVGVRTMLHGAWWTTALGGLITIVGVVLGTLRRRLVFDRDDGLLRTEQRVLGVGRRSAIPLFHLRAVVVAARLRGTGGYTAFVERRAGGAIHLDEARRPGPLLALAGAIAEVSELRLVYDNSTRLATEA